MNAAIQASGLGKQYRRAWALRDCTLAIPEGHVAGLVGPNGAGKTTLLRLATGMLAPTRGTITVLGQRPAAGAAQLARVGFAAQDTPVYSRMTVADHLRLGAWLNPGWDDHLARQRISQLALNPKQRAGSLSGGQRAQLALTLALAKRPGLLILDEPVASLDPLARREFLQGLMEAAAGQRLSVLLSSHLVADLERVCDHLILLAASKVQLCGDIDTLLAGHQVLVGPRKDTTAIERDHTLVQAVRTARQTTLLIRRNGPVIDPDFEAADVGLEELVLGYMGEHARLSSAHLTAIGEDQ